jgi:hypothetical protein
LTLAGLLAAAPWRAPRAAALLATSFAVLVGLGFHAAQPLSRGLDGIMRGDRVPLAGGGLPGASVQFTKQDQAMYLDLLEFIEKHAAPDDTILALPMAAELYFLADRKAPVRFAIAPLGLRSDRDVEDAWRRVEGAMPAVIAFKPDDKYTTAHVRELMDLARSRYRKCRTVGPFELYATRCLT